SRPGWRMCLVPSVKAGNDWDPRATAAMDHRPPVRVVDGKRLAGVDRLVEGDLIAVWGAKVKQEARLGQAAGRGDTGHRRQNAVAQQRDSANRGYRRAPPNQQLNAEQ